MPESGSRNGTALSIGSNLRRVEQQLQRACVAFFDTAVGARALLIAIPNGEKRDRVTAAILKGLGVRAGVADAILVLPGGRVVWIEFKRKETDTPTGVLRAGKQSPAQRDFESSLKALQHIYRVIDDELAFVDLLKEFRVL